MASLFRSVKPIYRMIDAGAGVGSLTAAWVAEICSRNEKPEELRVTAYETDPLLAEYLCSTLELCAAECREHRIAFSFDIRQGDFIEAAAGTLSTSLLSKPGEYDCAIMNPPYRKINSGSETRLMLRCAGIETSNLYTAFLALVCRMLVEGGELVAITPRSFCNGPYFRPFREEFLREMALRRIHVFESRNCAFKGDDVLQENVILHAIRGADSGDVAISTSAGPDGEMKTERRVSYDQVVHPEDPDEFIHIVADGTSHRAAEHVADLPASLADLGLTVSTGRVVEFRAKPHLRNGSEEGTVPLIYPVHFLEGHVAWPKPGSRKPNAIVASAETAELLVPAGTYVLVKRFSSKEERRRIMAALYDPQRMPSALVGFENHLNYYHGHGSGMSKDLAKGLVVFLNSTLTDSYFRSFNGHTQVNATDLRSLRYPSREALERLGGMLGDAFPDQSGIDQLVEGELMANNRDTKQSNQAKTKLAEAQQILRDLGLPRAQQNDRSALTLLALLDMKPADSWPAARRPLRGITQMMTFFKEHYGKEYAPNSRETVRRQTVHQFREAGLIHENPDKPDRPTNSGLTVYQIETAALAVVRTFGTDRWVPKLKKYLTRAGSLAKKYAHARAMHRIPLTIGAGAEITLSPGGQNILVEQIVNEFCPRFTPGGQPIYVGDTAKKWAYFDVAALEELDVEIEEHGKMPDVVVHLPERNWLVLIEAVTSHGPVNPKRHNELKELFGASTAGLVFVTAFLTRHEMARHLPEIAWETEVWVAEAPDHLVHFNGERFLGPY